MTAEGDLCCCGEIAWIRKGSFVGYRETQKLESTNEVTLAASSTGGRNFYFTRRKAVNTI
jgi:hypothetical protein